MLRVDLDLRVKVADFGLTRDIYTTSYYRQGQQGRVPVKWMAPESLHDKISNEKTDVVRLGRGGGNTFIEHNILSTCTMREWLYPKVSAVSLSLSLCMCMLCKIRWRKLLRKRGITRTLFRYLPHTT